MMVIFLSFGGDDQTGDATQTRCTWKIFYRFPDLTFVCNEENIWHNIFSDFEQGYSLKHDQYIDGADI